MLLQEQYVPHAVDDRRHEDLYSAGKCDATVQITKGGERPSGRRPQRVHRSHSPKDHAGVVKGIDQGKPGEAPPMASEKPTNSITPHGQLSTGVAKSEH